MKTIEAKVGDIVTFRTFIPRTVEEKSGRSILGHWENMVAKITNIHGQRVEGEVSDGKVYFSLERITKILEHGQQA